ncbi:MAG: UDP-2,3-diacylglucosamine diphosphatase [Bacteroidales bacterium]|nr:UDP-2,3-diacylglucosamine diphosphatase [Bacteroidales bacterium]
MEAEHNVQIPAGKKIYFASDFHLGIPDYQSSLHRELKLVRWLDQIKHDALEVFLMGDVFDFWFEYKTAVPKGYARLFGKLAELTDSGIIVHLFKGNHDIWAFDYLKQELNIQLHRDPVIRSFSGQKFFLSHGDGVGPGDFGYKLLKGLFELKFNQWLFRWIHPDIGTRMGLYFSQKSRIANVARNNKLEKPEPIEEFFTYRFSKDMVEKGHDINYFIFGHNHKMVHQQIADNRFYLVLGDWISMFSYAEFDGQKMQLLQFEKDNLKNALK